jgi:hypothetical protein
VGRTSAGARTGAEGATPSGAGIERVPRAGAPASNCSRQAGQGTACWHEAGHRSRASGNGASSRGRTGLVTLDRRRQGDPTSSWASRATFSVCGPGARRVPALGQPHRLGRAKARPAVCPLGSGRVCVRGLRPIRGLDHAGDRREGGGGRRGWAPRLSGRGGGERERRVPESDRADGSSVRHRRRGVRRGVGYSQRR